MHPTKRRTVGILAVRKDNGAVEGFSLFHPRPEEDESVRRSIFALNELSATPRIIRVAISLVPEGKAEDYRFLSFRITENTPSLETFTREDEKITNALAVFAARGELVCEIPVSARIAHPTREQRGDLPDRSFDPRGRRPF